MTAKLTDDDQNLMLLESESDNDKSSLSVLCKS